MPCFWSLFPKFLIQWSREFRPISLVGCVYKLLMKILAIKLKKVMPLSISLFQGAFVQSRHILDGVLIVNKLINRRKCLRQPGIIFKFDREKSLGMGPCDYMLTGFGLVRGGVLGLGNVFRQLLSVIGDGSHSQLFKWF